MHDQVQEVKERVEIVEVIGERVSLKRAGRHYKGLCPFHSEKSPSLMVSPERQSFKCFGCGEGGDVISFLQKYEGYSFWEALENLAQRAGVVLESYKPSLGDVRKKRLLEIMSLASEFYRFLLTKHQAGEGARAYLQKRKVGAETSQVYQLGYAPAQWRSVSEFLMKKKGYQVEELEAAGVIVRSQGHYYDRFRGRLIFPLRDHKGSVVGLAGRVLEPEAKEAKYINSPETELYHKSKMLYGLWEARQAIKQKDQIVIVEGEMDVLASFQAGVKNVVAIKGSAFTNEMGRLISRYTRNIVYALDADQAGREAVKRAVKEAEMLDLSIRVIQLEGGKDPGEIASQEPAKWRALVKGAKLYWDFLLETSTGRETGGAGARQVSEMVIPELAVIGNAVVKAHYVRKLAEKLQVPEEAIYEEMERWSKRQELAGLKKEVQKIERNEGQSRRERVEEYLLALSLQFYPQVRTKLAQVSLENWGTPVIAKIWRALLTWRGEWRMKEFGASQPPEYQEMLDRAYLRDLTAVEQAEKEWDKTAREMQALALRERMRRLAEEIKESETRGNEVKVQEKQAELAQVVRKLGEL